MVSKDKQDKRRNRSTGLGEMLGDVLDPVLRKRGFASRDLMVNWDAIAPAIYKDCTFPDKLQWRRGAGAEGATLHLRCSEGQRLAVSHDSALISGAINRYFGYVLVDAVKLSAEPFTPRSAAKVQPPSEPDAKTQAELDAQLAGIEDEDLKQALTRLGHGLKSRRP